MYCIERVSFLTFCFMVQLVQEKHHQYWHLPANSTGSITSEYRHHLYRERVFEMNASDDRGIKAVREKVKKFAMNAISKNVDK